VVKLLTGGLLTHYRAQLYIALSAIVPRITRRLRS
jgi:hypothetical protein